MVIDESELTGSDEPVFSTAEMAEMLGLPEGLLNNLANRQPDKIKVKIDSTKRRRWSIANAEAVLKARGLDTPEMRNLLLERRRTMAFERMKKYFKTPGRAAALMVESERRKGEIALELAQISSELPHRDLNGSRNALKRRKAELREEHEEIETREEVETGFILDFGDEERPKRLEDAKRTQDAMLRERSRTTAEGFRTVLQGLVIISRVHMVSLGTPDFRELIRAFTKLPHDAQVIAGEVMSSGGFEINSASAQAFIDRLQLCGTEISKIQGEPGYIPISWLKDAGAGPELIERLRSRAIERVRAAEAARVAAQGQAREEKPHSHLVGFFNSTPPERTNSLPDGMVNLGLASEAAARHAFLNEPRFANDSRAYLFAAHSAGGTRDEYRLLATPRPAPGSRPANELSLGTSAALVPGAGFSEKVDLL